MTWRDVTWRDTLTYLQILFIVLTSLYQIQYLWLAWIPTSLCELFSHFSLKHIRKKTAANLEINLIFSLSSEFEVCGIHDRSSSDFWQATSANMHYGIIFLMPFQFYFLYTTTSVITFSRHPPCCCVSSVFLLQYLKIREIIILMEWTGKKKKKGTLFMLSSPKEQSPSSKLFDKKWEL